MLALLIFCNLPGQLVQRGYDPIIEDSWNADRFEHGWPMTWLTRRYSFLLDDFTADVGACFKLTGDAASVRTAALMVNMAACLLISLGLGVAFEYWRRQRSRLWQFHLRDVLLLTTLACLAAGWYAAQRLEKANEVAALARSESESLSDAEIYPRPYVDATRLREGGITWLRRLVGDAPFVPFDRTLDLTVNRAGLPLAHPCTEVVHLKVISPLGSEELAHLESFHRLEELEMLRDVSSAPGDSIELPRLARLRALYVGKCDADLTGFGRLPNLEWLELGPAPVNHSMLRELASLPELRTVHLFPSSLEPGCFEELAGLKSLESLVVQFTTLQDEDLRDIGQLAPLKNLNFGRDTIPHGGLRHLQDLRQLVTLDLSYNQVRDEDIAHLTALPKLEVLNLDETAITAAATGQLMRMKQLRGLILPKSNFSAEDLATLKKALPDCACHVSSFTSAGIP